MGELFPIILVTVAGAALAAASSKGFSRRERSWVTVALLMHVGFACAQVALTRNFYGGGDMFLYSRYGEVLARMMERDPLHVIPEVTALLLQQPHRLPMEIIGAGRSTGSMSALAAWTFYLLGPSQYAASIAFAMLSLSGKIAMYRVFRDNVDAVASRTAAIATLFIPSFVFWSSGMIKEAIAMFGLGWGLYGFQLWLRHGRTAAGWSLMIASAIPLVLVKPYVLFPFVVAAGAWFYWTRALARGRLQVRPSYMIMAAALTVGGIVVLGHYFPEYSLDAFGARTAELQRVGRIIRGGSTYELGREIPTTLVGQFAYAPAALASALFRPALFEAHNLLALANAVETTAFSLLFLRIFFTRKLTGVRAQIADEPFFVFCIVFVVAFGLAVGLASTNLGTLSRYRAPLLPFFVLLLLVLGKPRRVPSTTEEAHSSDVAMSVA